ncbi:MAG: hypothetical protein U9N04_02775, partial [Patescibacteria group bacterium]|nr:hypothetical protein [Patescibacteria group bacterium]
GYFSGYATGDITGQISFNCSNTSSCGSSDFKVRTDWRPASSRTSGGIGYIPPPSTGSGAGDIYIGINETKGGYIIDTSGRNFLAHINSQIDFIIEGNTSQHSAKIIDLDMLTGKIKVKLQSEPITIELEINEIKEVDLDNDGQDDLEIKYNELKTNCVDLTFTKLSEFSDTIINGDIIRNPNAEGVAQFDIYIVKTINNEKFKRLILSPHVFESYGHLKWENIKLVDQDTINSYAISSLVRCFDPENNINDPKIYKLTLNNDTGTKEHLNMTASEFEAVYDWDAVYNINVVDRDAYLLG